VKDGIERGKKAGIEMAEARNSAVKESDGRPRKTAKVSVRSRVSVSDLVRRRMWKPREGLGTAVEAERAVARRSIWMSEKLG
jgi:hypothetical protein